MFIFVDLQAILWCVAHTEERQGLVKGGSCQGGNVEMFKFSNWGSILSLVIFQSMDLEEGPVSNTWI